MNIKELDAGSTLSLSVTDDSGTDITDNVVITWYNTDGKLVYVSLRRKCKMTRGRIYLCDNSKVWYKTIQ